MNESRSKDAYRHLPLVYACSGCSSAAQLANALAVRSDRQVRAEMSCIVGVGGSVRPLLHVAKSGRKLLVLDGCPLHCAKKCLDAHGIPETLHIDLSKVGVKKRFHEDPSSEEIDRVWEQVILPALTALSPASSEAPSPAAEESNEPPGDEPKTPL